MISGSHILCTKNLGTGRTEGELTVVNPLVATQRNGYSALCGRRDDLLLAPRFIPPDAPVAPGVASRGPFLVRFQLGVPERFRTETLREEIDEATHFWGRNFRLG